MDNLVEQALSSLGGVLNDSVTFVLGSLVCFFILLGFRMLMGAFYSRGVASSGNDEDRRGDLRDDI